MGETVFIVINGPAGVEFIDISAHSKLPPLIIEILGDLNGIEVLAVLRPHYTDEGDTLTPTILDPLATA